MIAPHENGVQEMFDLIKHLRPMHYDQRPTP